MQEPEIFNLSENKLQGPSKSSINKPKSDVDPGGMCRCGRIAITLLIGLITTFILLTLLSTYPNIGAPENGPFTATCNTSEEFQASLYKLTEKVHNILEKQSLRHFLCYDALWGVLEYRGLLPWTKQVEICMEKEHLAKRSIKFWLKDFADANLTIRYCWKQGVYVFTDPEFEGGSVLLILFKEASTSRHLMRSGWNYYRWYPDCREEALHCFHPYLIDSPPMRKKFFGEMRLPVPHFNEVIQKNLYPGTWMLGSKGSMPKNC